MYLEDILLLKSNAYLHCVHVYLLEYHKKPIFSKFKCAGCASCSFKNILGNMRVVQNLANLEMLRSKWPNLPTKIFLTSNNFEGPAKRVKFNVGFPIRKSAALL